MAAHMQTQCRTEPTGEPCHDIYALARLISPMKADAGVMKADHRDGIYRLSADPPPPIAGGDGDPCEDLPGFAHDLLKRSVSERKLNVDAEVAANADAVIALGRFLGQRRVRDAPVWKSVFGSKPPRGTLSRVARALDCAAAR